MGAEVIDPAFIQAPEHRPKLTVTVAEGIPLIDLSRDKDELVREIASACKQWGFFQVINHGVNAEARGRIEAAEREFFALPLEEKLKIRRDAVRVCGYYDAENTKNVRDWKEVFDLQVDQEIKFVTSGDDGEVTNWTNQWPERPAGFREACEEYFKEVQKLSNRLFELIALGLGLAPNRLSDFFKKQQTSRIRFNHYPPCPEPHLALGLGHHKDSGALTVLAQDDVGGLEVRRKTDEEWIRVKPIPDSYIINVGDIIQVWSNDRYESVEHRVMVNFERERFSIPFFNTPSLSTIVKPLEELIDEKSPPKYREYSWGNFLITRKGSNFKKLTVENIQIYHFRIPGT